MHMTFCQLYCKQLSKPHNNHSLKMMEKSCLLTVLFVLQMIPREAAAFSIGGGVGVGIGSAGGGGGGGVWIGGGINTPTTTPSGPSSSNINSVYPALQAWKSAITDDPLRVLDTWVGTDVCSYRGIFCAADDVQNGGLVTSTTGLIIAAIDLNHANLQGTLVKELSVLTDMSILHLNSNRFSGTIPDTFKDLVSLQELDLSNNCLSGPFPLVTLYMPSLIYLDIRFNGFSGSIPEDLFDKKLDAIFLNNNQFVGEIPQNLGSSPASVINLANNKLSGSIPASLGFLNSKLKEILLLNNQLSGCIPEGVGLFAEIQVLDVSYNSLMGHLPDTISCLGQIEVLNLAHNELSGELPDLVCSLKSLANLTVAYNFFSGFSQECEKLFFRNVGFDFSVNCIRGRNMQRPQPQCSVVPGGGLSCLRIPAAQPLICGSLVETLNELGPSSP